MAKPAPQDDWMRIGEVIVDSGHLLITTPAKAAERGEDLWNGALSLADSDIGGPLDGLASVVASLPFEGRYIVERKGTGADFELRVRYVGGSE